MRTIERDARIAVDFVLSSSRSPYLRDDTVMPDSSLVIRRAAHPDLPALGRLGADLVQTHYIFDAKRFMRPSNDLDAGYAWFLGSQLGNANARVLVAEADGQIVGYIYAAVEPVSWQELRDEAGFIHDVVVDQTARRRGVAACLIEAAIAWLHERGMPRVLLQTAERNEDAQRLFSRLGFRRTLIEMAKEIEPSASGPPE
ncbi:MAG: GNAT family N-acetyltransferase [Acidobacteria bacterium]|nr:GNAT family N-acetyltransferase [Acidobacteriota bacterium]